MADFSSTRRILRFAPSVWACFEGRPLATRPGALFIDFPAMFNRLGCFSTPWLGQRPERKAPLHLSVSCETLDTCVLLESSPRTVCRVIGWIESTARLFSISSVDFSFCLFSDLQCIRFISRPPYEGFVYSVVEQALSDAICSSQESCPRIAERRLSGEFERRVGEGRE